MCYLRHHIAFVCRRMLHVTARDLSLFFIFQLLWFACLDVYHAFLLFLCSYRFCVPTNLFFMWVFLVSRASEGLWLSLCFFRS